MENYNSSKIVEDDRNTREEIVKYLSLHGLECVALGEDNKEELEVGTYCVMKPHESLENGLRFDKPAGKGYLPDYNKTLERPLYMFFLEMGDEDIYSVIINTADTAVLKEKFSWIKNYDGLLYIIEHIPKKGSRIAFPSEFKGGGNDKSTKKKLLEKDPYVKDLPVDPEEFYVLVDQIYKEMTGAPKGDVEEYDDEIMDGEAITGDAFRAECNVDWAVFKEHGMVFKFVNAYFDVGEYFRWVTGK